MRFLKFFDDQSASTMFRDTRLQVTPPQNQWSELVVTFVVAVSAWLVAASMQERSRAFAAPSLM